MWGLEDIREPLYAVTLWQPWAWAMFHGKPVENRTWHPPKFLLGRVVAIHAGRHYEREAFDLITHLLDSEHIDASCPKKEEAVLGGVVGFARLVRSLEYRDDEPKLPLPRPPSPGVCGCVGISHGAKCPYLSPWFFGPIGWMFDGPVEFRNPVLCKGAQGFWRLEGEAFERTMAKARQALVDVEGGRERFT